MRLAGKVALVTGAGAGIGRAIALAFLDAGARVVALDLDASALERLAGGTRGRALETVVADAGDASAADRTVGGLVARHARVDAVVTCAAVSIGKRLADTGVEEWERVFAVNVTGTFLWFRAAIPAMAARGGGALVAIASQLAVAGGRDTAAYVASKGAVISMVKSIAVDYADQGIRANAILPGATETALLERAFARAPDPAAARERSRARHPMGRFARPEEIAAAAVYLASDEAAFVTGIALPVDGGWLAG
jgi:NAD(P)-dependent dehydrogenase (short-subunit alcohol dehydrogenase family)